MALTQNGTFQSPKELLQFSMLRTHLSIEIWKPGWRSFPKTWWFQFAATFQNQSPTTVVPRTELHQRHLENTWKHSLVGPSLEFAIQVGLWWNTRNCAFNKFTGEGTRLLESVPQRIETCLCLIILPESMFFLNIYTLKYISPEEGEKKNLPRMDDYYL